MDVGYAARKTMQVFKPSMKLESHFDQSGFTGFFVNSVKLGKVSKEYDITMEAPFT